MVVYMLRAAMIGGNFVALNFSNIGVIGMLPAYLQGN